MTYPSRWTKPSPRGGRWAAQNAAWAGRGGVAAPANLPTLTTLNTTVPRGVFGVVRLYPGYTGNLIEVQFNGATHDVPMLATGHLDSADLLAWWGGQAGGGDYDNGPWPRVRTYYNQNAAFTGNMQQTSEALMHVMDPNNIKADGYWPASNNGYNARNNTTAGVAPTIAEENHQYATTAGTISSNTGNNSVAMVIGGVGNNGNAGTSAPQNSIMGMNHGTAANRWTLRSGDTDWTQRFGFGFDYNGTRSFPAAANMLRARINRQVVLCSHSTAASNPLDTIATPWSNIRVNGVQAESYTVSTARTSQSISTTGFLKLGSDAAGGAATGDAFEFYAMILYSNSLVAPATTPVDQRAVVEADLISIFNVRTVYTYQLAGITSSSGAYRGNAGLGIIHDVANRLRDVAVSVEWYGHANPGSSLITDIEPNRAFISSVKRSGMTKTFAWMQTRSDINNGTTGAAYYTASASVMNQLYADGWTNNFLSDYFPQFANGSSSQAQLDIDRGDFNTAVNLGANQTADHYIAISPNSLAELADFNDYTKFDDRQHPRCNGAGGGSPGGGTYIAAQIEAAIRAVL